ncbi:hypothetical protein BDB00DRAFT_927415 [Zychaea mexicana]|uniref:uncharacterized protein n=1 Tax=Zychaea mexicana TaxID=64656 RepID=UPI0022FEFB3C|nr:uncharacterized protein BDB00DRAFT_927415 [Zychaea mexicana]KAI9495515.1 hypothetical protein BDB00DRAFT_927415 [Zychaea mexicana]
MSSRRGSTGPQQTSRQFQRGGQRDNTGNGRQGQYPTSAQQPTASQSRSTRHSNNGQRGKHNHSQNHNQNSQQQQQPQQQQLENTNDLRSLQLRRILLDEDDLARRNASAVQLIKSIEDSRQKDDPAQTQHEFLQLVDVCLFKQQQSVRSILESMRPHSNTLKNSTIKLISILGCYCGRLDIVLIWIFEHLQRWTTNDTLPAEANRVKEFKLWLLRLLRQAIADAASDPYIKCQLYDLSSNIMSSMILFLDAMDTPDYLPEVLQVLDILATSCPTTFSEKFQDIIDLLVGWHIDTGLSEHRRSLLRDIYKKFRPFWPSRLTFAFELLQHFLSDMQSIIAGMMAEETSDNWDSKWQTCESLFSCFHAMVFAIVPLLSTSEVRKDIHVIGPIFDLLRPNVLNFLCHVKELSPSVTWMEKSNQVLLMMFTMIPRGARLYQRQVYEYFASQVTGGSLNINPQTYLKTLMKLIDSWSFEVDEAILQSMLDVDTSPFFHLRVLNRGNKQLNSGILVILRSMIRLSNTDHVQSNTSNVLARHLAERLATITSMYSGSTATELKRTNQEIQKHTAVLSKRETAALPNGKPTWSQVTNAVVDAMFFSYLLLDAAAAWSNYKKQHFLLVLDTTYTAWRCKCSDVFDACVQVLLEFCSSCSFLLDDEENFGLLANLYQDLCESWATLNLTSRQNLCGYIKNMLYTVSSSDDIPGPILDVLSGIVKLFLEAIEYERNSTVKEDMLRIATHYCRHFNSTQLVESAHTCIQNGLDDSHSGIRSASCELLSFLNPFLTADIEIGYNATIKFLETVVVATPHTGSFRPAHYEIVMANLGMAGHLIGSHAENAAKAIQKRDDGDQLAWARRLFHHCASIESMRNVSALKESKKGDGPIVRYVNNSRSFLKYWAMWEVSRYCMLSRLRTPFGGPQQTLAAFERMLSSLVTASIDQLRDDSTIRDNLSNLLLLLNRLEVQIYNASNGCATNALPAVPRSSLAFFRTNKKTCKEYFARIRPAIIQGSKLLHDDNLLICNTLEMIQDLELVLHERESLDVFAWFTEINSILYDLVRACIKMTASDLIHGIQAWYKRIIRKVARIQPSFEQEWVFDGLIGPISTEERETESSCPVTWFQVAAQFALGHHEDAIQYLDILHSHIGRDEFGIMDMLDNEALDFYTCIEDYDSLKRLYDANGSMFSKIFSRELMMFAESDNPKEVQPTCDLSDFYSSLRDLGVTESIQLGRLLRFRIWLSQDEPADHIQKEIDRVLADRARLSLEEGALPERISMIETQLLQSSRRSVLDSINDYYTSFGNPSDGDKNILETAVWGRLSNYVEHTCEETFNTDEKKARVLATVRLRSARVARKQGNLKIADSWLEQIPATLSDKHYHVLYEKAKVLLLQPDNTSHLAAMEVLNEIIVGMETEKDKKKLHSKACLEAARLLKASYNDGGDVETALLGKLDPTLVNAEGMDSVYKLQSPVEIAIDTILKKSVQDSKLFRKPWFEYATYHYKQGWRILDELSRSEPGMPIVLWARQRLRDILKADQHSEYNSVEVNICGLLQKHSGTVGAKAIADIAELKSAVQQLLPLSSDEQITQVLGTMATVHNNIIETFRTSVTAYFQYLSLGDSNAKDTQTEDRSTSMVMTATLRLLRILVKYSDALQSVFCGNIEHVSIKPWKKIIPQLFARLNHPSSVVQKVISQLLGRICDEYPREIIYDVIVSSSSSKTNRESKSILNAIANRMMERNETLWLFTQRMAEELEKITVLWEEKWSYKFSSLALNAIEQFTKLDQEAVRLRSNHKETVTQVQIEKAFFESYNNVMKFIISSIDKLLSVTILNTAPKTPHEQWFVDTFGKRILHAFEVLQKPKDMSTFRTGWDMFIQLNRNLVFETHKVRVLELDNVSPYLASLRNSAIGIPGMSNNDDNNSPVYIDSFGSNVVVLPTKTKPKKLDIQGTDGKKYSYLFKGLEDLHLDERVMQLLNTVNGLLREDKTAVARDLKTRTYAVIPLSDHSGMIQWVNDATPLFALYKRWQKREQTAKMLLAGDKATAEDHNQPLRRPTELFTSKIEAALKGEGLRVTTNRRHWPKHILKKVYLELVKETPGDLLAKEIWCSSSDAAEWLQKSTSLSRSLAVMSVIGYIIGLGDRHLDNILIDYRSGEVIHIDYNVCFEKGRQLRVPELVPFRLTQNMLHALGVTGTDGIFRIAAEETMRVLRKHKEVLMTLLDAFVYDPLVHWATEAEELEERQIMELQINLGLVAKRLAEKRSDYEKRQQCVVKTLFGVTGKLQYTQQASLQELHQQAIDEAGSDDEVENESFADQAKKNLHAIAHECSIWANKHGSMLASLTKNVFVESFFKESHLSEQMFAGVPELSSNFEVKNFLQALSTWVTQKNAVYQQCFEEVRTYKNLTQPVARKLLIQDCCSIWPLLQQLIEQSFAKTKAEEVWRWLQQEHFSQFMQNLESSVFNYASTIAQALTRVEKAARQPEIRHMQDSSKLESEFNTLAKRNPRLAIKELVESLVSLESAFRRLDSDDQEYTNTASATTTATAAAATTTTLTSTESQLDLISVLPEKLQSFEQQCHLGSFGHCTYVNGILSLAAHLQCHVDALIGLGERFEPSELRALQPITPCAKSLYLMEDECLTACNAVFEGLLADGQRTKTYMVELQGILNNMHPDALIGSEKYTGVNPLYGLMQKPFEHLDRFCNMAKDIVLEMGSTDVKAAIETYSRLKRRAIMCLMRECLKHTDSVPLEGWTTPLISTWGITCSAAIGQHIKSITAGYVSSIYVPFITALIQAIRQKLPDNDGTDDQAETDSESQRLYGSCLHQLCVATAKDCILTTINPAMSRYGLALQKYEVDIMRFHWYNAPYIQTRRPLLPESLLAHMSNGLERLHHIENELQTLDDIYTQLIKHVPQLKSTQNTWQAAYRNEHKKCITIMDIYTSVNHLESCREGFTQAMIIGKEIGDNLEPFMVGEISEGPTNNVDDNSIYVSRDILREVRKDMYSIYKTIAVIKSPVDDIVSLLESIAVIEVDTDNDLSPAQQSAKSVLDAFSSIHAIVSKLNSSEEDWSYSRLNDSVETCSAKIRELFASLHALEEFGADRQDESREQHPSAPTTTAVTLDVSAEVESSHEQSSQLQILDDRFREPATTTAQTKLNVSSSSQQDNQGQQGILQQQQQRRDTQVLNIMRRIRSKLEGKDFGAQHKLSVSEQVTKAVEQSVSVDNLCAMYEAYSQIGAKGIRSTKYASEVTNSSAALDLDSQCKPSGKFTSVIQT